ncbi:MFS transporter [Nonomuraea angiospora]|uniref:MFS transporter n=1 Tax=Nonomuraea angiospora TaxID=46172 RepID=UPI003F545318
MGAGFAIGMASMLAPAYIAEVAPPAYRGRLGSFQQLAIVLGIAVSQLVSYVIASIAGGNVSNHLGPLQAWQWMLAACAIPALLYLLLALKLPESPRYLIMSGRTRQVREVLTEIEGEDVDLDERIAEIQHVVRTERVPGMKDLRGPALGLMPTVWIGITLSAFQQFVGINVIFYYSTVLWQSVGINQSESLLISFSSSIINIIGTLIAMALVDKIGRKPLLMIGSVGMAPTPGTPSWLCCRSSSSPDGSGRPRAASWRKWADSLTTIHHSGRAPRRTGRQHPGEPAGRRMVSVAGVT